MLQAMRNAGVAQCYDVGCEVDAPPRSQVERVSASRGTLEMCCGVVALSLGVVMAGTGEVATMRFLRELRNKVDAYVAHHGCACGMVMVMVTPRGETACRGALDDVYVLSNGCCATPTHARRRYTTYGNHMAYSMAIGFLFLHGGTATFSRTPEALAALVCALHPRFPNSPTDGQYHLQALRHLYVLAVTHRYLSVRDIDSGEEVYCPLSLEHPADAGHAAGVPSKRALVAPCLLPQFRVGATLTLASPRYVLAARRAARVRCVRRAGRSAQCSRSTCRLLLSCRHHCGLTRPATRYVACAGTGRTRLCWTRRRCARCGVASSSWGHRSTRPSVVRARSPWPLAPGGAATARLLQEGYSCG